MPNPNTRIQAPVQVKVVTKPYIVTFTMPISTGVGGVIMESEPSREMVHFARNGADAENQIMRKHNIPSNQRDRFIKRTVQCKGGPATLPAFQAQLRNL